MFNSRQKILLGLLAFIQFSHIVDFMILMPLGQDLMNIFDIQPSQFGLLVSGYNFSAGLMGLVAALFLDRFDRKSSLLFFYCGFSFGTLACAFASRYEFLLIARIVTGAFGGVLGAQVLSIVGDQIEPEKRGTATGVVMGAFSLASIFGVPFSLYLANTFDWHAPFMFLGILSSSLIVVILFGIPEMKNHVALAKLKSPLTQLVSTLKNGTYQKALLFMLFIVLGQFTIIPFLSPSFVANAGLAQTKLPLIYLVGGLCSMILSPLVGRLSDLYGSSKIFISFGLFSIIPILLVTNLGPTPIPMIVLISATFFIGVTGRMVPAMSEMNKVANPESRGSFMSLISATQQFGGALGAYIAGTIVKRGNEGQLVHYDQVGYLAAALSLVAFFLFMRIVKQNQMPEDNP
ncbi:MAG: MFS transporter [Pseudobdellovibrionaceae bacterium]